MRRRNDETAGISDEMEKWRQHTSLLSRPERTLRRTALCETSKPYALQNTHIREVLDEILEFDFADLSLDSVSTLDVVHRRIDFKVIVLAVQKSMVNENTRAHSVSQSALKSQVVRGSMGTKRGGSISDLQDHRLQ